MIAELLAINGCVLAIYYCADEVYRISAIDIDGRVLDFDSIFFCQDTAVQEAKLIIRLLTR